MIDKFQSCPKCFGAGIQSKPPHIAGDRNEWTDTQTSYPCTICKGAGIINTKTGKPPNDNGKH